MTRTYYTVCLEQGCPELVKRVRGQETRARRCPKHEGEYQARRREQDRKRRKFDRYVEDMERLRKRNP